MELLTIMESIAKFNNKKYYKVKANESKYMLFKSRDDFEKIEELEIMVFDLVRFAISGKDKKEIILSRMKSIEKYLKTLKLQKVKVRVFDKNYDSLKGKPKPNGYDDAFDIMFSSLSYFFCTVHLFSPPCSNWNLFYRKLETEEMKEKFKDLISLFEEALK